jgi:transcriptional regulator with XRE-family HTH domain
MALTLRMWRLAREISQQKMADDIGVHVNTYLNWEKNPENISMANAEKISKVLDVPLNEIVFRKEV